MSIATAVLAAAAALQCPGSGMVERVGAPTTGTKATGREWVDEINARTEGFVFTATIEDGAEPRVLLPRQFVDFPTPTPMVRRSDDGDTLRAIRVMGMRTVEVEYNRPSGLLVIVAPEGRWVGRCGSNPAAQ